MCQPLRRLLVVDCVEQDLFQVGRCLEAFIIPSNPCSESRIASLTAGDASRATRIHLSLHLCL